MIISRKLLRAKDKKAPGVFQAVAAISKEVQGRPDSLEVNGADYRRLLGDFGLARGLGDTVAKVAAAFGVKPCGGCQERRRKLNRLLPY